MSGEIIDPLSIDPNEKVTPSHFSVENPPPFLPNNIGGDYPFHMSTSDGNCEIGTTLALQDGAEMTVTDIGVIPPPPMFSGESDTEDMHDGVPKHPDEVDEHHIQDMEHGQHLSDESGI